MTLQIGCKLKTAYIQNTALVNAVPLITRPSITPIPPNYDSWITLLTSSIAAAQLSTASHSDLLQKMRHKQLCRLGSRFSCPVSYNSRSPRPSPMMLSVHWSRSRSSDFAHCCKSARSTFNVPRGVIHWKEGNCESSPMQNKVHIEGPCPHTHIYSPSFVAEPRMHTPSNAFLRLQDIDARNLPPVHGVQCPFLPVQAAEGSDAGYIHCITLCDTLRGCWHTGSLFSRNSSCLSRQESLLFKPEVESASMYMRW